MENHMTAYNNWNPWLDEASKGACANRGICEWQQRKDEIVRGSIFNESHINSNTVIVSKSVLQESFYYPMVNLACGK
jgi:hypothetical protein